MADRTTAELFRTIFELLAKNPTEENKKIALRIWPLRSEYDFSNYQMDADASLVILGLAKMEIDKQYPEDGEIAIYANDDGVF